MKKPIIPILYAGLAVGCSGDALTSLEEVTPDFGRAGNSGCYSVKFTSQSEGSFPVFPGTQSGDLDGTHLVTFEFPPTTMQTGRTWNFLGEVEWTTTKESVLGERTFTTSLESRNVFNDPEVFAKIANLKARALSGVRKANLTGRGQTGFPIDPGPPPVQKVDATWNGVICP